MLAIKSVKGKIIGLTRRKKEFLDKEYSEFNHLCKFLTEANKHGMDEYCEYGFIKDKFNVYSLTKTQAIRNCSKTRREQPLTIHNQSVKIEVNNNKLSSLWVRIPVHGVWGGIWLPVKTSKDKIELIKECKTTSIRIKKKKNDYFISITIQKEIKPLSCSNILAIDLGEKTIATVCGTAHKKPLFLGKNVRGTRRHYAHLRKQLGNKKLLKMIRKVGQKEKNKVNSTLHKISKIIVEVASKTNSLIILGNLRSIRNKSRGKRLNRIVSNMPYHKLTQMINYKATWKGITVKKTCEAYTSITCNKCDSIDKNSRKGQGLFKCQECGYQVNADYNACENILKRSLDYMFGDGALAYAQKSSLTAQA